MATATTPQKKHGGAQAHVRAAHPFRRSEPAHDPFSRFGIRKGQVLMAILGMTARAHEDKKGTDVLKAELEKLRTGTGLTEFEFRELVKEACRIKINERGPDMVRVKGREQSTDILIRRRYFEIAQLLVIYKIKPEEVFGKKSEPP